MKAGLWCVADIFFARISGLLPPEHRVSADRPVGKDDGTDGMAYHEVIVEGPMMPVWSGLGEPNEISLELMVDASGALEVVLMGRFRIGTPIVTAMTTAWEIRRWTLAEAQGPDGLEAFFSRSNA